MLTPGASGYGMMVYNLAHSCSGCGDYVPYWIIPVFCKWVAITEPDGTVNAEVLAEFHPPSEDRYQRGPMVGISEIFQPEYLHCCALHSVTIPSNIEMPDEYDCDEVGIYTPIGFVMGLAPVLSVIPIEASFFASWYPRLNEAWQSYSTLWDNFTFCSCNDSSYEDESCMVNQIEKEYEGIPNAWSQEEFREAHWHAERMCTCPFHGFIREMQQLGDQTTTFVSDVGDDLLDATWAYALDRYFAGWKWLEQFAPTARPQITKENAWLISFLQRFSPLWESYGLDEFLKQQGLTQYAA